MRLDNNFRNIVEGVVSSNFIWHLREKHFAVSMAVWPEVLMSCLEHLRSHKNAK